MTQEVDNFLAHYGVKGMRWGIRKKTESEGVVASPARKSRRRVSLEGKYLNKGMSRLEAEQAADKRIRIEKQLAILGATTVAAVGVAVVARKIGRDFVDVKLKEGLSLQHVTDSNNLELNNSPLFTTFKKADKRDIHALFPKPYQITVQTKTTIKAPSNYKARKMLSEVLGKDGVMSAKEYARFNYGYFYQQDEPVKKAVVDQFFNKIREAGYNSLLDPKPGGYRGVTGGVGRLSKPLIVLDGAQNVIKTGENYVAKSVRQKAEINRALKELAPRYTIMGSFFTAAVMGGLSQDRNNAINEYYKDNPGSSLSRSEVAALYYKN